ncbi:MAG: aspartyl/asparaginyl beta-hydroxylase domain-containing protein [Lysobacter sp.]
MPQPEPTELRANAHRAAENGRPDVAEAAYLALLKQIPDDVEALNFVAMLAMSRQQLPMARELLERARNAAPDDGPTRKNLGVVLLQSGDPEAAEHLLLDAVRDDPDYFVARLYLGLAFERRGRGRDACVHYFKAIGTAQAQGLWTSPGTTPGGLRANVEHAIRFTRAARRQLLDAVLAPLHARFGRDAMKRVDRCLAVYLGEISCPPPDARQKPGFLYFPDLPSEPFLPRQAFPWYEALEARTPALREELVGLLDARPQLEPFLGEPPPGMKSSYLGGGDDTATPQWDGFFFYRHGRRYDENCRRSPKTVAALESTSIVHIRDHAPEALFSVLGPGSHILPHHGVTNTRAVTHLPLIVPGQCTLRVADQRHDWQEGRCVTFDDTFEHEAWNRSERTRVILLFDVWNPYLTEAERIAITELVAAIGDLSADQL